MRRTDYLREKTAYVICHLTVTAVTVAMLFILNPAGGRPFSVFVGILYLIGASLPLEMEFHRKKTFYNILMSSFDRLDRKNLLAEMLPVPDFFEGALLHDILRASNKACLEEINRYKNMQAEYREYIELWVHEIKTPIASAKLTAQNHRAEAADSMAEDLEIIEGYVEQALFYARSNAVEKDYLIKELRLEKLVFAALKRDSKQLIRAGVSVLTHDLDITVYSDAKWLEFIIHQLIVNSIKYAKEAGAQIEVFGLKKDNCCILAFFDNGLGIPENELNRIFDKGFTGTNGRLRGKSTGMGLYICRKLCDKLGHSLSAESVYGNGTTISVGFPKSSMTDIVSNDPGNLTKV